MSRRYFSPLWYRIADRRMSLSDHVEVRRHRYRGRRWYVLRNTLSGRVHRLSPGAFNLVGRLDGSHSVDAVWSTVVADQGDAAPSQEEVITLLSQLYDQDMLKGDAVPYGSEIIERLSRRQRSALAQRLMSPLSVKLPIWNPTRFLDLTLPIARPFIGIVGLLLWLVVVATAASLAVLHKDELLDARIDQLLAAENVLLMLLCYPVVKALHELGHAYVTRAYGGNVDEMGVMLLVLLPVPYVDASSSTTFASKWQRAFVAAAGILVELLLAALALLVWLNVEPGAVRTLAYQVMLICGVSTLFVNGNPLLRFDGYFVLADLIEIPNLGTRSQRYWAYLAERYLLGSRESDGGAAATWGEKLWFLIYAPSALVYRLVVFVGISLFLATEYFALGVALAVFTVASTLVLPVAKMAWHILTSPRLHAVRLRACVVTGGLVSVLVAALLSAPAPLLTNAEGVIWLPEQAAVRAGAEGFVAELLAEPGSHVRAGQTLARMTDDVLVTQIAVSEARIEELEARLNAAKFTNQVEAELLRRELSEEQARIARDRIREHRLTVKSRSDGRLVIDKAVDLPGRFLREGEVMGYVTPATSRAIRLTVSQDDIELVRHSLEHVEIKLADRLAETLSGRIVREVPAARDELPSKALTVSGGGRIATDARDGKTERSLQRHFQFDVELEAAPANMAFGTRAYVKFVHQWEPLGWQAYRRLRQLFLSRLNA